jgi:hypothetical protein
MVKDPGVRIAKTTIYLTLKEQNVSQLVAVKVRRRPSKVPVRLAQSSTALMRKLELSALPILLAVLKDKLLDQTESARAAHHSSTQVMMPNLAHLKFALATST